MDFIRLSQKIEWCDEGPTIASWTKSGINHGFSGKKFKTPADLHHLKQVHGVLVRGASKRTASDESVARMQGDAIYAHQPGIAVAVKTADCLPILFFHKDLAMAVHAGWRSAAHGIIHKALAFYQSRGISPRKIRMALGPCIGPGAFEVGPEVVHQFRRPTCGLSPEELAYCLTKGRADRWYMDLATYGVLIGLSQGLQASQITVMRSCTLTNPGLWHSYRRDGAKAGRNWSFVSL